MAGYGGGFVFILDSDAPYEMELFQSGKSVIKGGLLQQELVKYEAMVMEENQKIGKLRKELDKAVAEKHLRSVNELQVKLDEITKKAQKRLGMVVEKNKNNVFAAYVQTAGMERMDLNGLKACYANLTDKAKMTGPGRLVAARIQALEGVDVNAVAPNFTLQTPEGENVSLYDVKGKMISVSLDEKKDKWLEAIKKDGLTWLHLSDLKGWKGEIVKLYNIDGVPTIFVLDENNRIIAKNLRGEKLRAFVEERLK